MMMTVLARTAVTGWSGALTRPVSAVLSHPAAMLGTVATWTAGEVLGFDFETTGIDRFNDVPVSYALVPVVGGVVRAELVRPHRPGPRDPGGGDRGPRDHDRAGS